MKTPFVTKNRFEPLSLSETFCTENDTDLIEDFNCSSNKQGPDSNPNKVVPSIGQATELNRESRSRHNSIQSQGQKVLKNSPQASIMDDKYELVLQVKNKNKEKLNNAKLDLTHQKWNSQNKEKFGFIPLGQLILSNTNKQIEEFVKKSN